MRRGGESINNTIASGKGKVASYFGSDPHYPQRERSIRTVRKERREGGLINIKTLESRNFSKPNKPSAISTRKKSEGGKKKERLGLMRTGR